NGDGGIVRSSGFIAINSVCLTIASVPIVGQQHFDGGWGQTHCLFGKFNKEILFFYGRLFIL
ncbi:MAG: hypothetical protein RR107_02690, partial [Clostridia bacterium]